MTIELSGNAEQGRNQYQGFPGRVIDTMPVLIEQGYIPASVRTVIDRRISGPEEVRQAWNNQYFFTGDLASTDNTGIAVLTLDAPELRGITPESKLYNGALVLTADQLNAIENSDASITLTPSQVGDAHCKGFTKRNGIWQPENTAVATALNHYLRGQSFDDQDFQTYAQGVSDASHGSQRIFTQYFDQSKPRKPHGRSVVVVRTDYNSYVSSDDGLSGYDGFFVGVAPEAPVARENGVKSPSRRDVVNALYHHIEGVPATKGVTKKGLEAVLRQFL